MLPRVTSLSPKKRLLAVPSMRRTGPQSNQDEERNEEEEEFIGEGCANKRGHQPHLRGMAPFE